MNPAEYEKFVASLYYAVEATEKLTENLRTIAFETRKKIRNSYGVEREFDVYWEYEIAGHGCKTVIECKNYNSRVTIEKIDALVGKLGDIDGAIDPVLATKTGYQSGARAAAEHNNVELLVVREQDISDWTDENGQPLIRRIPIEINFDPAALIHDFVPELDAAWIKDNTDIDTSQPVTLSGMNNELFIDDRTTEKQYSLHQLASYLDSPPGERCGRFTKKENFDDAYFVHPKYGRLKMLSYTVDYSTFPTITETIEIDFGDALVGVIEYLQRGEKKLVFKDKVVTRQLPAST